MKSFIARLSLGVLPLFAAASFAATTPAADAPKVPPLEKRSQWWRQGKFGMFIHWGVYSVPAHGEWYMNNGKVQVKDYEKYAPQFNPTQFNAKEWVRLAKEAGMKYITITSKHHDGFSMFDSKLTNYDIVDATPFKRDPIKELAEECRKQGIRLCFYYSVMDWHHPDYLPRRPWETRTRPADGADFNRYIDYMKGQLKELLTRYGPIGVIWFDGGWEGDAERHHSQEVVDMIRSIQPNILINDRINLPEDFSTPEQTIPAGAMPNGRLWETCMTMNNSWGFNQDDHDWKSTTDLARKLIDIASKGGNFLLNVGPMANGKIPQESVTRLHEIGQWMDRNGECIYGTTKSPYQRHPFDGRCTVKGNTLYVEAFSWPAEGINLTLKNGPKSARLLDGEKLNVKVTPDADGNLVVNLARPSRLDPIATVAALNMGGPPEVVSAEPVTKADEKGTLTLKAEDGIPHGGSVRLQGSGDRGNFGYWTDSKDYLTWNVQTDKPGLYAVEVSYSCEPGAAGAAYEVTAAGGEGKATGEVKSTGGWDDFKTEIIGRISMPAGKSVVTVRPTSMPNYAVMNLQRIRLIPNSVLTQD
jgi:alpha-L-fucosidase